MISSIDYSVALNEALQWKEEVGLPALEQVEQLKIEINYYKSQEIVYKSQLEILTNEMNEKISMVMDNETDKDEILMETKLHLKHVSIENTMLSERLNSMEAADDYSKALNLQTMQLQERNQHLQDSNLKNMQIIHRLTTDRTKNREMILGLNTKINQLNDKLLHMSDICMDTKHEYRTVLEQAIAENEQYIVDVNDEFCKCIQFAKSENVDDDDEFYSNELAFARAITLSSGALNSTLVLNNAQSCVSVSEECSSPKIFRTDVHFPAAEYDDSFALMEEEEDEQYIIGNKDVKCHSAEDEKQKEQELISDINIYDIEIESLTKKLGKYKCKFLALNEKYAVCKKALQSMNVMYAEMHAEKQQTKKWFNYFFCAS